MNEDELKQAHRDFLEHVFEVYPLIHRRFKDIGGYFCRHGHLPPWTDDFYFDNWPPYKVCICLQYEGKSGRKYSLRVDDTCFVRFSTYTGRWYPPAEYNETNHYFAVLGENPKGRFDELYDRLLHDGIDPEEGLEAYSSLFDEVMQKLFCGTICVIG